MGAAGSVRGRFGRMEGLALALGLAWAIGLVVAAMLAPAYQTEGISSSGTVTSGSATLVAVNGWGVLLAVGVPGAAVMLAGGALWRRAAQQTAGVIAWTITVLLACFNLVAMLSIGVFVLPVTLALVAACSTHGHKPPGAAARPGE